MKTKAIIVDIDGTLANIEHRRYHVAGKNRDWVAFFEEMDIDEPIQQIVDISNKFYDDGYTVLLCSGRPDNYKERTKIWIEKHGVKYHSLSMRKAGDYRSDVIVKWEMLVEIRKEYDVYFTLDDRAKVVQMWRDEGLLCLQVAPGDFDNKLLERVRKPNLYIMVGPAGAGKSTFINSEYIPNISGKNLANIMYPEEISKDMIISSDGIREQLCGDFRDQSKNDEVFAAIHDLAKTRLKHGLDVVLDATHARTKDRKSAAELGIEMDAIIHYVIINRPLKEKLATGGWRLEVDIKGKNLVEYHDQIFNSNIKDILNKDGFDDIIIHDYREK